LIAYNGEIKRQGVKIIKYKKIIWIYTFVFVSMLMLLLSTTTGTIVWGKGKPARPGKPVETWDLKIWLEEPGEDIVLLSPFHDGEDPAIYLFAEDIPCSGGLWEEPMKKGKNPNRNNYLAAQVDLIKDYGDDCGTYQLPASLDTFPLENNDIVHVSVRHNIWPMEEGMDYWTFAIHWVINPDPYDYEFYQLDVWTDKGDNPEGTLSEEEGWIIPFNGAEAMLYSRWDNDGDGVPDVIDWTGSLSFTIRLTRTLHVA
jgi:hypothetical protein